MVGCLRTLLSQSIPRYFGWARARVATILVAALTSLLIPFAASEAANTPPQMTVPGQYNVSPTGAFVYSIPIIVPPSTGGMGPALSLDYSSQNGDGPEGIGWALTGLPTISHCPRTMAQDGVHGGVNYDSNDRYCLNGQRLVAISGTYGADGTQYRTEIESFSQIISHGTKGNGPSWFEVHTKAGQTLEFGDTLDSSPLAVGKSTVRAWAVNKISDTKGNYLTVIYENDQTNGQAYPLEVEYTGNATAGLAPFASVKFSYTTRSDIVPTYQAGSLMQTTVLLTDIETYYGSTLVSDYKLAYRNATSAATHDELTSVTRCDGHNNCLAPLTFGWQGSRDTLTYNIVQNDIAEWSESFTGNPPTQLLNQTTIVPGDYNGDGDIDALVLVPHTIPPPPCPPSPNNTFFLGDAYGVLTPATPSTGALCKPQGGGLIDGAIAAQALPTDFNGDGISDLAYANTVVNYSYIAPIFSTGTGFVAYSNQGNSFLGDVNGDGRTDIGAMLSNGDGTFSSDPNYPAVGYITEEADFDGDGCADVIGANQTGAAVIGYTCNPAVPTYTTSAVKRPDPYQGQSGYLTGDFNGDGKQDIIDWAPSMFLSTGTSLIKQTYSVPSGWVPGRTTYVGDFNGDGKSDIASISANPNELDIYLSTGTGFVKAATIPLTSFTSIPWAVVADWNNDGAADLWIQGAPHDEEILFQYVPELMMKVSNGIGGTVQVTYDRLNKNGSFYTKGTNATYPTQDMDGPQYVVARIDTSNGLGTCTPPNAANCYTSTYTYAGAKNDLSGRGFLGFSQIAITDVQTGVIQTTNYDTAFPLTGFAASQIKTAPKTGGGTVTLLNVANTPDQVSLGTGTDNVHRYFVGTAQSQEIVKTDENFATGASYALPTSTTTNTYDCDSGACGGASPTGFGNITQTKIAVSDGSSRITTNTWTNDSTHWLLARLTNVSVESKVGSSDLTRTSASTYDMSGSAPSGLVTSDTLQPSDTSNLYENTAYSYDGFGNKTAITLSSYNNAHGAARTTSTAYDTSTYHGQFATEITNALNQSETWNYDPNFGVPINHTGPNGLTTTWSDDGFGRQTLEVRPDQNRTAIAYAYCSGVNGGSATCPTYGAFVVTSTPENSSGGQNGPIADVYYDALSRVIATDIQGFDGSYIRTTTQYDTQGHVGQTSRPYFVSANNPKWTVFTYDPLARVTLATFPDGSTTTNTYCGLTTSVTDGLGHVKTSVKNAQALIASVVEAVTSGPCQTNTGNTTTYVYDAFGDLTQTTDPASNHVTNTYDLRGRKTASSDPDMGNWSYGYDAFSELTSQTDAKSQQTTLAYDVLGRITQRVEPSLTSNWVYDTAAHGIGSLAHACTGSGCSTPGNSSYFRAFTYDTLSRPSNVTLTIGGATYTYITAYNSDGHIDTVTYPSQFVAKYVYTSLGYLSQIKDNVSGTAYWTANTRDAELHLTSETAGNGLITTQQFDPNTGLLQWTKLGTSGNPGQVDTYNYSFDVVGNLLSRQDVTENYTEHFCYDNLNRLQYYALGTTCTSSGYKTMAYSAIGNIASKSDAGAYTYSGAGPHAVTSIAGTVDGIVNPTFTYDANGNMLTGIGRTITPTSFNMASQIVNGSTTINFTYDSEHQRIIQSITGSSPSTTSYLNDPASGSMSELYVNGSGSTWRDYIIADGHIVAQRTPGQSSTIPPVWGNATTTQWGHFTWTASAPSGPVVLYFTLDHLGSIQLITDSTGAVSERDSYDAWGKRRNPDGTDASSCTIANDTTRGFTNQEMMDEICAVNLNARIYDPAIGRFMVADTIVQDSYSPQTFNRYSYVNNSPLSFTDPTGNTIPGNDWDAADFALAHSDDFTCTGSCMGDTQNTAFAAGQIQHAVAAALTSAGFSASGLTVNFEGGAFVVTSSQVSFAGVSGSGDISIGNSFAIMPGQMGQMASIATSAQNGDLGTAKFASDTFAQALASVSSAAAIGGKGGGFDSYVLNNPRLFEGPGQMSFDTNGAPSTAPDTSGIETVVVTADRIPQQPISGVVSPIQMNNLNVGAPPVIQIAAANDNYPRNWVCTEAAYNCIMKAPPGRNRACFTAENLCNESTDLLKGAPPNAPSVTVIYPYGSGYVIIYPGGTARYVPGPNPNGK